jgi:exodeoxyribonuclease VII large subunit
MADGALFDDAVGRAPGPEAWTVAELSAHLGRLVAAALPDDLWVEGQIRNLKRSAAGHVYFDLAEPTAMGEPPRAQLAVTLLAPEKRLVNEQLKRAGGAVRMDDGIEVRIAGRVRWYGPRGVLQVKMHGIDPAFTLGRLQADRDRILAALVADGLLDRNGRLPLPLLPLRLGLVTSRGSAAHADVLAELAASGIGFTVRSVDARTQGADCGPSVARALHRLAADDVDLVLLVRGGGSRTDLASFDSELIARAIAAMPVPVFTGIGHEIDRSIADEVAHRAHKTPTAAADAVVELVRAYVARVDRNAAALQRAVHRSLAVAASRLGDRTTRTARVATRMLDRQEAFLAAAHARAPRAAERALGAAAAGLDRPQRLVGERGVRSVARAARHLDGLDARIRSHDPRWALARGWSITTTDDGRAVRDPAAVAVGTRLTTRVAGGRLVSTVTETHPDPRTEEPEP